MVDQSVEGSGVTRPIRVFVSYAHDPGDLSHGVAVRQLWEFLRAHGIDAQLDMAAAGQRQDWALWMADQIRQADCVLVVASLLYREQAEGRGDPTIGHGVQWEARLIRDAFYRDQRRLDRFVPVVLPGQSAQGVPDFLAPATTTVYAVSDFTMAGAESLLRLLTRQPEIIEPPLGQAPVLRPHPVMPSTAALPSGDQVSDQQTVSVRNDVSGSTVGTVIQAGTIGSLTVPGSGLPFVPGPAVGAGVRGWKPTFQNLHSTLDRQAEFGGPITEVEFYGPGVRQELAGGWVLCALPDRRAAAVADPVWDALHDLGSAAIPQGPLEALGFPVASGVDGPSILVVEENETRLQLDGGTWGPGRVRRAGTAHEWEWEPEVYNFSRTMTRVARNWTGDIPAPRLRVRAIASMNLARSSDWQITPEQRRAFEAVLPNSELASMFRQLSYDLDPTPWQPRPDGNYPDRARYVSSIVAPNGDLAVEAEVMLAALSTAGREVVTCAEIRVYDYDAWTAAVSARGSESERLRLTLPEVRDILLAAWQMVTGELLDLLSFPTSGVRWREVPHVEFRLTGEYDPIGKRPQPAVADMIDFTAFGPGLDSRHTEMAVTIPTVPRLSKSTQREVTRQALAYLGRSCGYLDATADQL